MKIKYAIAAIVSIILLLLTGSGGFCADTKSTSQSQGDCAIADNGADKEGELPDNPLLGDTSETGATGVEDREEAGFLSNKEVLTDKVREALEALRDSLRRGAEGDGFEIPLVLNEAVARYIRCFTGPKRDVFARWLWRSERYAPTIKSILKKNGLPEDLVYLSMIESGFNMKACSPAKASGPWQLINETGRRYGLKVDYWVDERYDLEKSTVAAARYL
ncbi:MAG TPA: lytic transglycosylase domain-containing protein, partial [Syntrophorhabdales bacterium]|nr:lytic transglycosylase domain-containing protein [Syntrophorhabdales bacterium]